MACRTALLTVATGEPPCLLRRGSLFFQEAEWKRGGAAVSIMRMLESQWP
jgi:hypothetical protein